MLTLCICCAHSFDYTQKIAVHTCTRAHSLRVLLLLFITIPPSSSSPRVPSLPPSPLVPVGLVQSPSRLGCETCSSRSADLRKNRSLHSSPADETSLRLFCCLMKRCHETGTQPAASPHLLYKTSTNPPKLCQVDIMSTTESAVKCTHQVTVFCCISLSKKKLFKNTADPTSAVDDLLFIFS